MQMAGAFACVALRVRLAQRRGKLVEAHCQIEVCMARTRVACLAGRDSLVRSALGIIYPVGMHGLGIAY